MPHREAYNTSGDHDTARVLEYRGGWLCSITSQVPGHGIGPRGETTKGFKVVLVYLEKLRATKVPSTKSQNSSMVEEQLEAEGTASH
jgi:hypothetical protein